MKIVEIEYAVQAFREPETMKAHARINSMGFRQQEPEIVANEMARVDARVSAFRASLGEPEDQPEPVQSIAQTPSGAQDDPVKSVMPGTK